MSSPTIHVPSVSGINRLQSIVRYLGRQYLASNPGFDTVNSNNYPHDQVRRCVRGEKLAEIEYCDLADFLLYRSEMMSLAEEYVRRMGLSFMAAADFDQAI